jgi:hypothetical protein
MKLPPTFWRRALVLGVILGIFATPPAFAFWRNERPPAACSKGLLSRVVGAVQSTFRSRRQDALFQRAFRAAYANPGIYHPESSHVSVHHFLSQLSEIDADTQVLALSTGGGFPERRYHFVLLRKQRIYDFSHPKARSLSVAEYVPSVLALDAIDTPAAPDRIRAKPSRVVGALIQPSDHLGFSQPSDSWQSVDKSKEGWLGLDEVFRDRVESWKLYKAEASAEAAVKHPTVYVHSLAASEDRAVFEALVNSEIQVPQDTVASDQFYHQQMLPLVKNLPGFEIRKAFSMVENLTTGPCTTWAASVLTGAKAGDPTLVESGHPNSFFTFWGRRTRPVTFAVPGDLIVYLGPTGHYQHVGIVASTQEGTPLQIDSKWGRLPAVFRHGLNQVPTSYGNRYAVFRKQNR